MVHLLRDITIDFKRVSENCGSSVRHEMQHGEKLAGRIFLTAILLFPVPAPCIADPAPVIHYAPAENLEHGDVLLIDRAEREIDMAAYVLTGQSCKHSPAPPIAALKCAFISTTPSLPSAACQSSSMS